MYKMEYFINSIERAKKDQGISVIDIHKNKDQSELYQAPPPSLTVGVVFPGSFLKFSSFSLKFWGMIEVVFLFFFSLLKTDLD